MTLVFMGDCQENQSSTVTEVIWKSQQSWTNPDPEWWFLSSEVNHTGLVNIYTLCHLHFLFGWGVICCSWRWSFLRWVEGLENPLLLWFLSFWTFFIVCHSKKAWHFESWICFVRRYGEGGSPSQLHLFQRANFNPVIEVSSFKWAQLNKCPSSIHWRIKPFRIDLSLPLSQKVLWRHFILYLRLTEAETALALWARVEDTACLLSGEEIWHSDRG
jgi:hypothetical protein